MNDYLTFEEYKSTISDARKKGWRLTNCYFLPDAVRTKLESHVLSFHPIANGLFLLEDCESFYRLYYFLHEEGTYSPIHLDKNTVVEFPYSGEMNQVQQLQVDKLKELGFVLGRESGLMTLSSDNTLYYDTPKAVRIAAMNELPGILDLFLSSFDPRYAFLPDKDELASAIQSGSVLVVPSNHNQVYGALYCSMEKKTALIRLVAVDPAHRGCGYGRLLVEAFHQKYRPVASVFQHWVDLHNDSALRLYSHFGYSFSLRKANEYILNKTEEDSQ